MRRETGRRGAAFIGLAALLTAASGAGLTGTAYAQTAGTTVVAASGAASGQALHIEINIPGLPAISEDVSLSTSTATLNGTGEATATLFKSAGPLAPVFDGLNQSVAVSSTAVKDASAALVPTQDAGGLVQVGAGLVEAHAATSSATGSAELASLDVGLGGALTEPLQAAIDELNTQITTINNQVQPVLQDVIDPLTGAVPTTGTPLDEATELISALPEELTIAVQDLQAALDSINTAGGVASIGIITNDTTVEPFNGGLRATSVSKVGDVNLLGTLVQIDAMTTTSVAAANGKPGGATTSLARGDIAQVQVGSLADLKATVDGLEAVLGNQETVAALTEALGVDPATILQPVIDQINALLGTLGVQVGPLGSEETAAADGTKAVAFTNGVGITVGSPLDPNAAPLLALALVPSRAEVQAQATTITPPAPPKKGPERPLAYTGFDAGLGGALGVALLIGAVIVRRRMA